MFRLGDALRTTAFPLTAARPSASKSGRAPTFNRSLPKVVAVFPAVTRLNGALRRGAAKQPRYYDWIPEFMPETNRRAHSQKRGCRIFLFDAAAPCWFISAENLTYEAESLRQRPAGMVCADVRRRSDLTHTANGSVTEICSILLKGMKCWENPRLSAICLDIAPENGVQ